MKNNLIPALRLTLVCMLFFMILYPLLVFGIAQIATNQGNGETLNHNGKKQYLNLAQKFTDDKYFQSRPSAVNYNPAGSAGSNKAPSNPEYLAEVKARIDTFLVHNPEVTKNQIPSELITASGSGLDPHLSLPAALIQVKRIAKVRNVKEKQILELIEKQSEKPLWGLFGTEKVNVLKLNIELEKLK